MAGAHKWTRPRRPAPVIYAFDVEQLRDFFSFVTTRSPTLLPVCRWLLFGPEIAGASLQEHAREPALGELTALLQLLKLGAPELMWLGHALIQTSDLAAEAYLDLFLDQLLAAGTEWHHPVQVLGRPHRDYTKLLAACTRRLKRARGAQRRHLAEITVKVERALRIEKAARKKRARMRKKAHRA